MLLPLLGACAVVGPFHGPEWEPVQDLLSEDRSCRDPRCCGNLLILCLFLIWQVRHYWHQATRTHLNMKKVIKVPPQKWAVPSRRHNTCFGLTPEFFSPGKFRGLDAHVQQWAQKKRWEYQRSLQESWAKYLLSWQHLCQDSPWDFYTPSEPIFCTASFSSTFMLPQDSSWEAWKVPWCLSDDQTHLICKPLPPALDMYQRMKQLLVHSQEALVPLEHVVSMRSHPASMTLITTLPNLPSAQRLQFCSREFLPVPSNQQVGMPIWKSWGCPQEAWVPERETQTLGREDSREIQAPGWVNQRENRGENAWEIQASGRQLPINFGMEDNAETKVLEQESQRLVIRKADGEILTPGWENQDQVGVENRAHIQELGKRNQREAGGENPPETRAHRGENREQLRCKIDAETQTPEWENQGGSRNEDAVETRAFEKNKREARGEDEGEIQAQGLGKQDQTGSENGEETQVPEWGKQDQLRGDTGTEIQGEERRNKDQDGGETVVQSQIPERENLGEVKKGDGIETQVLGWGKQECIGSENVTEIQTPGWEQQDQGRSEKAGKIQASRGEIQKQLKHELRVGWGNQGLRRGEDVGETQISRRKNLREIREEDWVVIQAPWWEDKRPVASEIDRQFEIPCWGNQDQIEGEHRAEIQAPEKRDQRKHGDEDGTNTLAPQAESQGQLRDETPVETHPPGRRTQEQFGDENSTDIQAPAKRNLRGVKGEDGKEIQELAEENQGQLRSEINAKIHTPKWKNQEHIRGKEGANAQASEAQNWGELTSKIDGETLSPEWKEAEQVGGKNVAEIQAPEKRSQREAEDEDDTETWVPGEENQSQLRSDIDRKTNLSKPKNQDQMGVETGTEMQALEKRNQREAGGEEGVEIQRPNRENQGQLDSAMGESHSPGKRNWEQTRGENDAENQTLEKRNQREIRRKDGRKIQRLLKSEVNEKTCLSEWKSQEQIGGENGAEIQIRGKRNLRGTTGDDVTETQPPGGDYQGQLRSEIDGEIQIQGQENQNKGGDEDAAEIRDVGNQRKCRAEDADGPQVPSGGNKDQVRGKDAAKGNLRIDCSEGEGPSALTGSRYGATEQEQVVASAPCPEIKPLPDQGELFQLASGEGEYLASQRMAPTRKHRTRVSPASQQAQPKPQRSRQRDKGVDPGKASNLTRQLQNPQSLATPLGLPSACPSLSCSHAPQAATALVGDPTALTVLPKWPVLKKSQQLLLESLMRRKIAHLKWGLPQQILESYVLSNFLEPCPLPLAEVRLPGLYTARKLQGQQERHCEAQGSRPGFKSSERSQRDWSPERKSSKLPTQARVLEKCGSHRSEPMGISIHPEKPRRVRPPRGPTEQQDVQEEAPPRAKLRNPRPAAESKSWCGRERVREPSSENSRSRKMVRPGVSQMAERAPSRVRTSYSRVGHDLWKKEHTSQEASKPLRLKRQQPTHWRRGSLEPAEGRGAGQQSSSCSTDTSSFKGSLHSAVARLSMTLLNKISWSPHLANPRHSAPKLSLRDPDPTLLPKVGDPHAREDSIGVHASLKRELQPPGHCCAGATLPKTESPQGQGETEDPHEAPQNPPAPKKFGYMKHLRCFLLQHGFRK
ncbi:hypothetical protein HPG69_018742 [Diceros bicornis minor]|uniref:Uncharacterized protein n=1 Tax=Diceros bicornis minor TaxID=77932 RepID=A0A7J7EDQ5_DICBM|nr:hypothetical protein HPG69_018742 [Diceros bicornis minor]